MFNLSHITYLIYVKGLEYSLFNNYIISHIECRSIIANILSLPKDIAEIYCSKEQLIRNRLTGLFPGYHIEFISNISEISQYTTETLIIIVLNEEDLNEISHEIGKPILFLSNSLETDEGKRLYNFKELTINRFQEIYEQILPFYSDKKQAYNESLKEHFFNGEKQKFITLDTGLVNHFYTLVNANTLRSIRVICEMKNEHQVEEIDIEKPVLYINKIKGEISKSMKSDINDKPLFDYIFSDVSYNFDFILHRKKYTKHTLSDTNIQDIDSYIESLKFMKTDTLADVGVQIKDEITNRYIRDYLNERIFIEQLISSKASSFVASHVKMKLNPNDYIPLLKEIGSATRENTKKINHSFRKLEEKFHHDIDDNYIYLNKGAYQLKLISNLPVEWSSHEGIPLMIRHEVSRIPMSPGFLTEKLLLDTNQLTVTQDAFKKILIISSFQDNDPIKEHLRSSIDIINTKIKSNEADTMSRKLLEDAGITENINFQEPDYISISVNWENVSCEEELVKILNENHSLITIFDLHGSHDQNGYGTLHLKNETISLYSLIGRVNISPIVILSSCDTSPYDRNHFNTANGFLLMGAKTVLASAVPILSKESSIFIARLIHRLSHFLHIQLNSIKQSIRWSTVITGMLRMTYYTELLFALNAKYHFSDEIKYKVLFFVNMHINPLRHDAFNKIRHKICEEIKITEAEFDLFVNGHFKFPECIKYVQIGNPELILIVAEEELI